MKSKKIKKTIMILQSSSTGRILLKKRKETWGFTSDKIWNEDTADVFNGINEVKTVAQFTESDELTLDYLGCIGQMNVWHCVCDTETSLLSDNVGWFPLFNFPDNFDEMSDRLFEDELFIRKLISPDS
jgi:hypothetical protein